LPVKLDLSTFASLTKYTFQDFIISTESFIHQFSNTVFHFWMFRVDISFYSFVLVWIKQY